MRTGLHQFETESVLSFCPILKAEYETIKRDYHRSVNKGDRIVGIFLFILFFIIGLSLLGISVSIFLLIRNKWVCDFRIMVLNHFGSRSSVYNKLPSYDEMLYLQPFNWNKDPNKWIKK